MSRQPGVLHAGGPVGNSGAQAINLAFLAGAERIVLFGFDMRGEGADAHFFGEHPPPLRVSNPFAQFIQGMAELSRDLDAAGVQVLNASAASALPYWPRLSMQDLEALCARIS